MGQLGVVTLFLVLIVAFSAARPQQFPTWDNARAIFLQATIVAVLGAGLTVVLVIGEFDLSFDANTALSGAIAVLAMTSLELPMGLGIVAGIGAGMLVGGVNGALVAFGRAPAFIGTLAVASVAVGTQSWITADKTTYGVPESYIAISTREVLRIPLLIWFSVGIVLVIAGMLKYTVFGRHAYAVGSNVVAADSAGIRTREVRFAAFVVLGVLAGVAGVLLTAQSGGSAPTDSAGLLLPVYTAAFLGASAFGRGNFNPLATYFGVIFVGTLATGLTMLQQPRWVANVITGLVLVGAILMRRGR